jgi:hypothetical protein
MITPELKDNCYKALQCLYIAVDASIADDVNIKVKDYVARLQEINKGLVEALKIAHRGIITGSLTEAEQAEKAVRKALADAEK